MKFLHFILSIFLLGVAVNAVPYLPTAPPTPPVENATAPPPSNGGYVGPPTEPPTPRPPPVATVVPIYP
uniref:Uncharacterized protein n=1 Tax=Musca domestica TaxID=7370 RepID=A0A1I8M5W7_MUSDO